MSEKHKIKDTVNFEKIGHNDTKKMSFIITTQINGDELERYLNITKVTGNILVEGGKKNDIYKKYIKIILKIK